jgi:NADH:ubiquinone oxidoreductase subunit 3 (subunit A)
MIPCLANTDLSSYLPLSLIVLMTVGFGVMNVVASQLIGPRRAGANKGQT